MTFWWRGKSLIPASFRREKGKLRNKSAKSQKKKNGKCDSSQKKVKNDILAPGASRGNEILAPGAPEERGNTDQSCAQQWHTCIQEHNLNTDLTDKRKIIYMHKQV